MPKLTAQDLIANENGVRPIEANTGKSLKSKIEFAWKVANPGNEYSNEIQNQALGYLKKLYSLSDELTDPTIIIKQLNKLVKNPLEPMALVPKITDLRSQSFLETAKPSFLEAIKKDVNELNELIETYNGMLDKPRQIERLQQIYRKKIQIENTYSDSNVTNCRDYFYSIQNDLFVELQKQFVSFGITSMVRAAGEAVAQNQVVAKASTLPEILANMSPEKTTKMLKILAQGEVFDKRAFKELYKRGELGYDEYQKFLKKNGISYLGGGHSENFKITPLDGSSPFVLKVENRMGMPKGAEAHLREHSLKEVFTPVMAERQVTGKISVNGKEQFVTRTLLVTEFCSGGDILSHGDAHGSDQQARLNAALDIYAQMGNILSRITQDGCAFPDMKNDNWLMDEKGVVRLADTKSFVPIEANGEFNFEKNTERGYKYIIEASMLVPECSGKQFSADKMHAMSFGKNLYQYLTECSSHVLKSRFDGAKYDFSAAIFQTAEGKQLAFLIKKLIKPNPDDRLSMNDAVIELKKIATWSAGLLMFESHVLPPSERFDVFFQTHTELAKLADTPEKFDSLNQILSKTNACFSILKKFDSYLNDNKCTLPVNDFLRAQEQLILQAQTPDVLQAIMDNLKNIVPKIQQCALALDVIAQGSCKDYSNIHAFIAARKKDLMALDTPEQLVAFQKVLQAMPVSLARCAYLLKIFEHDITMHKLVEKTHIELEKSGTFEDIQRIQTTLEKSVEEFKQRSEKLRENCKQLLIDLKSDAFGRDEQMNLFVQKIEKSINQANTIDALLEIRSKLVAIKNDPQTNAVRKIITTFRAGDAWYTIGMGAKADRIQEAMSKVPVEERGNIMQGLSFEAREVRKALASHRHFWRDDVYLDTKKEVDAERVASSFLVFKSTYKDRLNAIKNAAVDDAENLSVLNMK